MSVIEGAVAAARALLRMPDAAEDEVLTAIAGSAIGLAEAFLGMRLAAATREAVLLPDGTWQRLRDVPVTAILGVSGLPAEAYAIDIVDGVGWVRIARGAAASATVSYQAGQAADWAALPAPIAQGLAMLTAHLFEHREGDAMPPAAVAALWRPFRRIALAEPVR